MRVGMRVADTPRVGKHRLRRMGATAMMPPERERAKLALYPRLVEATQSLVSLMVSMQPLGYFTAAEWTDRLDNVSRLLAKAEAIERGA